MPNFNDFDLDIQTEKFNHISTEIVKTIICDTNDCPTFSTPATACRSCNPTQY